MEINRKILRDMIWQQLESDSQYEDNQIVQESKGEETFDSATEIEGQFELVDEHTVLKEAEQKIEEIRTISEEIRRMKQLVDFRSPLLSGK